MRMPKFPLLAALAAALTLVACGDGSVRSPGLIGSGELLDARLECRKPPSTSWGPCNDAGDGTPPLSVNAGQIVEVRVIGSFEDDRDLVATDRFSFNESPQTAVTQLTEDGADIQRFRFLREPANDMLADISATDVGGSDIVRNAEFDVTGVPVESVEILDSDSNSVIVVPNGLSEQLFIRVNYEDDAIPPQVFSGADSQGAPGNITWSLVDESSTESTLSENGVFRGQNPNLAEEEEVEVRVTLSPRTDGVSFDPESDTNTVTVRPAEYVEGSFEIGFLGGGNVVPTESTRQLVATAEFEGFGRRNVVDLLDDGFRVVDGEGEIIADPDTPEDELEDALRDFYLAGPDPGSAEIEASYTSFDGNITDSDTLDVDIREAGIGELFFRPVTSEDAQLVGLTEDGRLPCLETDPETGEPNQLCMDIEGALPENQTLDGVAIAYRLFARLEGDVGDEEAPALPITEDTVTCSTESGVTLPIFAETSDETVATVEVVSGTGEEGVPNGIATYFVTGLAEGTTELQARLGRELDNEAEEGINCFGSPVADAKQEVLVGFPDMEEPAAETAALKSTRATQSIDMRVLNNAQCVGYINAVDLLTGNDPQGGGELLAVGDYLSEDGMRLMIPLNQQRRLSFEENYGSAGELEDGSRGCPDFPVNFADQFPDEVPAEFASFAELESPVAVTKSFTNRAGRGLTRTKNPLSLGTACVETKFDLSGVAIAESDSLNTPVTITALPLVDTDIARGASFLSGESSNGICESIDPVLGLGAPGVSDSVVLDLVGLLGGTVGVVLNNEVSNEFGSMAGEALLEGLGILGEGLDASGLTAVLDGLLGVIGLGDNSPLPEPVPEGSILGTLLEGLNEGLGALLGLPDLIPVPGGDDGDGGSSPLPLSSQVNNVDEDSSQ